MPALPLDLVVLILFAALLHASWNIIAKRADDPFLGVTLVIGLCSVIAFPAVFFVPFPEPESWPYLIASALLHLGYNVLLGYGYRIGDMSIVYPVSRGSAPLLVTLSAWFLAGEGQDPLAIAGIAVISIGILSFAFDRPIHADSKKSRNALLVGLAIGLFIMGYQLSDGLGVRLAGNKYSYIVWLFVPEGPLMLLICLLMRRYEIFTFARYHWKKFFLGAVMGTGSYSIAIYAAAQGSLGHVSALRETSVVFGTIMSALFLKEKFRNLRYLAAGLVALGATLLASAR